NDRRWAPDDTGEVERRTKETARAIYSEAAADVSAERRVALSKHAAHSESSAALRAMLELASTDPEFAARPELFDADPWALNVLNGVLDLRTGQLRPHRQEEYHSRLAPVAFNPSAKAPRWRKFLTEIFNGDVDLI